MILSLVTKLIVDSTGMSPCAEINSYKIQIIPVLRSKADIETSVLIQTLVSMRAEGQVNSTDRRMVWEDLRKTWWEGSPWRVCTRLGEFGDNPILFIVLSEYEAVHLFQEVGGIKREAAGDQIRIYRTLGHWPFSTREIAFES